MTLVRRQVLSWLTAAPTLGSPVWAASPSKKSKKKTTAKGAAAPDKGAGPAYASRPEVMRLAEDIAQRRDLDPAWVRGALAQAHFMPVVAKLMQPAATGVAKNWRLYRSRFIEPIRIRAGVKFWQTHQATLERAEREFGVPAEIVLGILGVETIYGQQMGNFRVIDALATLAFDFPAVHPRARERSEFFLAELEQFLSLQSRSGRDPLLPRGSYAGAMGLPQFMPSSWVRHAIDFDGDGVVDLINSPADAIGSVARYLQAYDWQTGMPTHYEMRLDAERLDRDTLMAPDILPTFSPQRMAALGVLLEPAGQQHAGPLALIELQNAGAEPDYVAGTANFYAITRYNWSSYYAMAVIELGREVGKVARRETR